MNPVLTPNKALQLMVNKLSSLSATELGLSNFFVIGIIIEISDS